MRAILAGGPKHGAVYEVRDKHDLVFAVNFPVGPLLVPAKPVRPPKPSWWLYLRNYDRWAKEYTAWQYWKEPPYPVFRDVMFEQIVYRFKWWNPGEDTAIFWYGGAVTAPFGTANEIFHYLWERRGEAMHRHGATLDGYHWEMGHDWYRAIWNACINGPAPILNSYPGQGDMLVGLPVRLAGERGAPRIVENERVEAIR